MRFGVIIPAFNEEHNIAGVVAKALSYADTVVVVDDGSSDSTAAVAHAAGAAVVSHDRNKGKGAAIKTGFAYLCDLGFEGAITLDADGQHDPAEIPAFVREAGRGYDMIIGNRMGNVATMPFIRRFANYASSLLITLFLKRHIPDSQNGYRYYKLATVAVLPLEADKYDFETEVIFRAARARYRIGFVPTRTIYRSEARSKVNSLTDTLRFIGILLRYGLRRT